MIFRRPGIHFWGESRGTHQSEAASRLNVWDTEVPQANWPCLSFLGTQHGWCHALYNRYQVPLSTCITWHNIYVYIYMEQLHPWPIYSQLAVVCLYTLHDVWCRIYLSVVPQRHRLFESKSRVPENWRPLRKGELTQIKVLRNGEDIEHKVWEFIGKIHTQWIPTGPLYKVYMGLIIKGTIPRVPPFSLWGILDVSLGGEKPETCSV